MMPIEGDRKEERVLKSPEAILPSSGAEMLNTRSGISQPVLKGVLPTPEIPDCLVNAFRQSWEYHWLSLLPQKYEIGGSGIFSFDVTELVSADLLEGQLYTKDEWHLPEDYRQSVIDCLNKLMASREVEICSINHKQIQVEGRKGFFDGLLRAEEIENHSGEYKHSFLVEVKSTNPTSSWGQDRYQYPRFSGEFPHESWGM